MKQYSENRKELVCACENFRCQLDDFVDLPFNSITSPHKMMYAKTVFNLRFFSVSAWCGTWTSKRVILRAPAHHSAEIQKLFCVCDCDCD